MNLNKKAIKGLLKVEEGHLGKIMLLFSMNSNILIPHPSYLGVYQDEEKTRALQSDKYLFWVGTKKNFFDKTVVHVYPLTLGIK